MPKNFEYWWEPHSQISLPGSKKYFRVYYDKHGRDVLIEEYKSDRKLIAITRLNWGKWDQVKIQEEDQRPVGIYRKWLWKMIERFLVQGSFRRSVWRKVICTFTKPEFLIRVDRFAVNGELQEYFLYNYFLEGGLAGVEQYLADGTYIKSIPVE